MNTVMETHQAAIALLMEALLEEYFIKKCNSSKNLTTAQKLAVASALFAENEELQSAALYRVSILAAERKSMLDIEQFVFEVNDAAQ